MSNKKLARRIGSTVREARKDFGLTQRQLALMAGVSERFIVSLELGESPGIRLDKLVKILDILDLKLQISSGKSDDSQKKQPEPTLSKHVLDERDVYMSAFDHITKNLGGPKHE